MKTNTQGADENIVQAAIRAKKKGYEDSGGRGAREYLRSRQSKHGQLHGGETNSKPEVKGLRAERRSSNELYVGPGEQNRHRLSLWEVKKHVHNQSLYLIRNTPTPLHETGSDAASLTRPALETFTLYASRNVTA